MARSVAEQPAPSHPAPRANPDLIGHEIAERELRRLFESGRMPHAMLLSGVRGIGKATLAFRFARFVLSHSEVSLDLPGAADDGLAVPPESGVFRRVMSGGHADLLTVERAWDPVRRRVRSEIVVDDAREIAAFLRLTAAEDGWRVVIVDGAEEMNRNAANALLKMLEEPPRRAMLLLVSHSPGRLLPTIRSRCRRFPLAALPDSAVRRLIGRNYPDMPSGEADILTAMADGSIGRALQLAASGGVDLYRALLGHLASLPRLDPGQLHAFADKMVRAEAADAYRLVDDLLSRFLADLALRAAGVADNTANRLPEETALLDRLARAGDPQRWTVLREDLGQRFGRTEALNLDRKQALLGAFFAIEVAARGPPG